MTEVELLTRLREVEQAAREMVHSRLPIQKRLDRLREALEWLDDYEASPVNQVTEHTES